MCPKCNNTPSASGSWRVRRRRESGPSFSQQGMEPMRRSWTREAQDSHRQSASHELQTNWLSALRRSGRPTRPSTPPGPLKTSNASARASSCSSGKAWMRAVVASLRAVNGSRAIARRRAAIWRQSSAACSRSGSAQLWPSASG
jgi:hypothetical protein